MFNTYQLVRRLQWIVFTLEFNDAISLRLPNKRLKLFRSRTLSLFGSSSTSMRGGRTPSGYQLHTTRACFDGRGKFTA